MSNPPSTQPIYKYTGDAYKIIYHSTPGSPPSVFFQGKMRLGSEEDDPLTELFTQIVEEATGQEQVVVDLRQLEFINSRGISLLYKFALNLRSQNISLTVLAVKKSTWQQATLNNITKLSPTWSETKI